MLEDASDHPKAQPDERARQRPTWGLSWRLPAARLLIALLLYIIIAPFLVPYQHGQLVSSVLLTVVLVNAALAMGNRQWTFVAARSLLILALVTRWLAQLRPGLLPQEIFPATALLFIGFVFVSVFCSIVRAPEVNTETLCAGVAGYLLLGMFWAFAYTVLASLSPNAFAFAARTAWPRCEMKGFTAVFFSYVTLSCVGSGDIVPVSPVAQMLSMIEAMVGAFYMAVMIARLVGLHSSKRSHA
jgi:hypothetical protein